MTREANGATQDRQGVEGLLRGGLEAGYFLALRLP